MSKFNSINSNQKLYEFKKWVHLLSVSYKKFVDPIVWNKIFLFYEDETTGMLEHR